MIMSEDELFRGNIENILAIQLHFPAQVRVPGGELLDGVLPARGCEAEDDRALGDPGRGLPLRLWRGLWGEAGALGGAHAMGSHRPPQSPIFFGIFLIFYLFSWELFGVR